MTDRDRAAALLQVYRAAAERMVDLPLYNPALEPELYGWRVVEDVQAGILVAPWCINLLWCPEPDFELPAKGENCVLSLPSGDYEGVVAYSEVVGRYGSASLLSDTLGFQSQDEAESFVDEISALIFACPEPPAVMDATEKTENPQRRALFRRMLGAGS